MGESKRVQTIKWLIWLYFWLLIFEGVLRKWLLPSLSGPLLFIRDPLLLVIYVMVAITGLTPRNIFMVVGGLIAVASVIASSIVLWNTPIATFFGFRANFLHLPLIFIIPKVFDINDVRKVGYWTLVFSIPLALLMVAQFKGSAGSIVNVGAGEGAGQIASAGGHVRASATFSYILGPIYFYGLVAVFLVDSQLSKTNYPSWLVWCSTLALGIAAPASGSRTFVFTIAILLLTIIFIGLFLRPGLMPKIAKICCGLFITVLVLGQIPVFKDALDIFSTRLDNASQSEGGAQGILQSRILEDFTRPIEIIPEVPPLGNGLGSGTIVGSVLLGGKQGFTYGRDSERELTRHVLESGPTLGILFIMFRFALFFSILTACLQNARRGNTLPLLLFSVIGFVLLNGQLAQTTLLGFAVIMGGLCYASMRTKPEPAKVLAGQRSPRRVQYSRQIRA